MPDAVNLKGKLYNAGRSGGFPAPAGPLMIAPIASRQSLRPGLAGPHAADFPITGRKSALLPLWNG
jgi:hypothetical protein